MNQTKTYYYSDGDTKRKEKYKLKGNYIYYEEKKKEFRNSPEVIGYTKFAKGKLEKDLIYINNNPYIVEPLKKKHKIYGYIETNDGKYIAFNEEPSVLVFILPCLIALIVSIFLNYGPLNNTKENDTKDNNWTIGGIEGTDVSLKPESEVSYNTYWGYQEITIDKTMKVPFVNKETNTAYAQFTVYSKDGEQIYQSPLIKPGTHEEWDAYTYYSGLSGQYLHDLKIVFFNPILNDTGEIIDFEASMFSATTPDFLVTIN